MVTRTTGRLDHQVLEFDSWSQATVRFPREYIGPQQDNVDMTVPSHYSAAPSGDLCTTSRFLFVVRGESRRSVPITGERPAPLGPGFSAISPAELSYSGIPRALVASPLVAECSPSSDDEQLRSGKGHPTPRLPCSGQAGPGQQWNAVSPAVADVAREQMKHAPGHNVSGPTVLERTVQSRPLASMQSESTGRQPVFQQPVHRRGDRFPRNSFFT
jgi:hypothetical protein